MNHDKTFYRYRLIETKEDFMGLRPHWQELLRLVEKTGPFYRWEWLYSWWESFAKTDDCLALVWVECQDEPFALAPFFVRRSRYYGLPRNVLRFIGEGNSDRADILVRKPNATFFQGLFDFLRERVPWDVVSLREVPCESSLLAWARNNKLARLEKDSDCPYIAFESGLTVDAFRKTLSRNLRREFANMTNRLKKSGTYRFEHRVLESPDDPLLEELREIEAHSSKASKNIHLVFSPKDNFCFQQHLIEKYCETVEPFLTMLKLDERTVAYLYGFVADGVYHAYNMAFLPEHFRLAPGKLTMQEAIDETIRTGLREFDFLRGNSYIKSKWSQTARSQLHLTLFCNTFFNRLHCWLIFSVRPCIKFMLNSLKRQLTFPKAK